MSQMRARGEVENVLARLGVERDTVEEAVRQARNYGLERPGHPMETYTHLIGPPTASDRDDADDPYRQVVYRYHLPLWPSFHFSVFGNHAGQTGGVSFTAVPNVAMQITGLTTLRAWEVVEDQIRPILTNARLVDEWYPQRDYEVQLTSSGAYDLPRCILRFDFQLLQEVVPLPRQG